MIPAPKNINIPATKTMLISITGIIILLVLLYFVTNLSPDLKEIINFEQIILIGITVLPKLFVIIILFFIFKIIFFGIKKIFKKMEKLFPDEHKLNAFTKIIQLAIWISYIAIVSTIIFEDITSMATFLGLIGFGLTFALQKPILNLVGWVTIIFNNLYSEGDRIKIGNVRGDVKEIQLMNTILYSLLETSDSRSHKLTIIPNEFVLTTNVENYTTESNYILDELKISITYESNYYKSMELLNKIITSHIEKNIHNFIKRRRERQSKIDKFLKNLNEDKTKDEKALQVEKDALQKDIEHVSELGEDFKPKIRIEMVDSAIILSAQFLAPYNQMKKNRTDINLAFMDAVKKEKDIELAYPHMEIIYNQKACRSKSAFLNQKMNDYNEEKKVNEILENLKK